MSGAQPYAIVTALLAGALALSPGCGTSFDAKLEPAGAASEVPGPGAAAANEGVLLTARPGVWPGRPSNLDEVFTPILVTIVNEGEVPLRIAYEQFHLLAGDGARYSALPPAAIDAALGPGRAFYPAFGLPFDPYTDLGIGWPYYHDPWKDPLYRYRFQPLEPSVRLPTRDMLERALAEGVLAPGAKASGFLYFEDLEDPGPVVLRATLPHADTGAPVGRFEIPFVLK